MMRTRQTLSTVTDCEGCGACCMHMGYPSFVQASPNQPAEEHWLSMPDDLRRDLVAYIAVYEPPQPGELDGPCYWFDQESRRCKHYQHRPRVCRDFKVGGSDCIGWRQQRGG